MSRPHNPLLGLRKIKRMAFLEELNNKLWHTTSVERYSRIIESGGLLPEPDIDDKERWKTSNGPKNYPFVRTLGGVSLFEFNDFHPEEYSRKYPLSSWRKFIPFRKEWKSSIWIEIEKNEINKNFISGSELLSQWKQNEAWGHTIMPVIESAHIGNVSSKYFKNVYIAGEDYFGLEVYGG